MNVTEKGRIMQALLARIMGLLSGDGGKQLVQQLFAILLAQIKPENFQTMADGLLDVLEDICAQQGGMIAQIGLGLIAKIREAFNIPDNDDLPAAVNVESLLAEIEGG